MIRFQQLIPLSVLFVAACSVAITNGQTLVSAPSQPQPIASAGCGGCNSSLGDCGRRGRFFEKGCDSCDSGCGENQCGGCKQGGLARLKSLLPFGNQGCSCQRKYFSIFGGWNDLKDYNGNNAPPAVEGTFNDGFVLGFARGRYLNDCTRFEMESAWRNNSGDDWGVVGATPVNFDGHFNNHSTMFNIVREFQVGQCARFHPYAGIGAGLSIQDGEFDINGTTFEFDDWAFAYQIITGVNWKQSKCVDWYAEYRYFGNTETNLERPVNVEVGNFAYTAENIIFGIRFKR